MPHSLCTYHQVLYLFNRNALLDGFEVRLAAAEDAEGVGMLVSGMPNSDDIREAFKSAHGEAAERELGRESLWHCTLVLGMPASDDSRMPEWLAAQGEVARVQCPTLAFAHLGNHPPPLA